MPSCAFRLGNRNGYQEASNTMAFLRIRMRIADIPEIGASLTFHSQAASGKKHQVHCFSDPFVYLRCPGLSGTSSIPWTALGNVFSLINAADKNTEQARSFVRPVSDFQLFLTVIRLRKLAGKRQSVKAFRRISATLPLLDKSSFVLCGKKLPLIKWKYPRLPLLNDAFSWGKSFWKRYNKITKMNAHSFS